MHINSLPVFMIFLLKGYNYKLKCDHVNLIGYLDDSDIICLIGCWNHIGHYGFDSVDIVHSLDGYISQICYAAKWLRVHPKLELIWPWKKSVGQFLRANNNYFVITIYTLSKIYSNLPTVFSWVANKLIYFGTSFPNDYGVLVHLLLTCNDVCHLAR